MRLKMTKMKLKMKNNHKDTTLIDLGLDMNTYILNIKCLSIMMVICIKQYLSNI